MVLVERQQDLKARALPWARADGHGTPMGFGDHFDDRQPEAAAFGAWTWGAAARRRTTIEALEDMGDLLGIDPGAGVDHRQEGHPIADADLDADWRTDR